MGKTEVKQPFVHQYLIACIGMKGDVLRGVKYTVRGLQRLIDAIGRLNPLFVEIRGTAPNPMRLAIAES